MTYKMKTPALDMHLTKLLATGLCAIATAITGFAQPPGMLSDASALANARILPFHATPHDLNNGNAHSRFGIFGIDSIPNFNGQFFADGFDPVGNPNRHWYTNTVGNPPQMGGTTVINAPIQAINVELDDADGNVIFFNGHPLVQDATRFVTPIQNSPVFSNAIYSSSDIPTQFVDAVQRAEYFNQMKPDWHTLLAANPKPAATIHIRQPATCPTGPNLAGCNYAFIPKSDGSCCATILVEDNVLLDALVNVLATDIDANLIATKDITTLILPDVAAFFGDLAHCCIMGFHNYVFRSGTDPEMRWVFAAPSWISPDDAFAAHFFLQDIVGVSHEMTEIYNDPFVGSDSDHNVTPWWLGPNGFCTDFLEAGDVLQVMPTSLVPISMNGFTYHPQNETLLQWFEFKSPSDALGGAYSYPNTAQLTQLSPPQKPFCAQYLNFRPGYPVCAARFRCHGEPSGPDRLPRPRVRMSSYSARHTPIQPGWRRERNQARR